MSYGNYRKISLLTNKTLDTPKATALRLARELLPEADELIGEWKQSKVHPSNWIQALLCAASDRETI